MDYTLFPVHGHRMAALELNPDSHGEPIILLHGFSHSIDAWRMDTVFQQYGRCIALSLPGHYPSTFPCGLRSDDLTPALITQVLYDAIQHLVGDSAVTLVGYSTGGWAALALAARYPQLAARVVSIAGFAHGSWTGWLGRWQRMAGDGLLARWRFKAEVSSIRLMSFNRFVNTMIWPLSLAPHNRARMSQSRDWEPFARMLWPNVRRASPTALQHYAAALSTIDITPHLQHIRALTLVLAGADDPLVPIQQSRQIAEHVTDATLALLPDAGHLLFLERPDAYADVLHGWLRPTHPR